MTDNTKTVLIGTNENTYVYMEYGAYLKIIRYAKAGSIDGSRGVFLGKREENCVYIYEALEAMYYGDEGLEAPSFTRQSWERIREEIKERYSDLQIMGQYSTHPERKPTEMDAAMQESFFGGGADLIFIFDPVDNSCETYRYSGGKFTPVGGLRLFDKYDNEIDLRIAESILRPFNREFELRTKVLSKFSKKLATQTRIYVCVLLAVLIAMVYLIFQTAELSEKYERADKKINDLQWIINQHEETIISLTEPTPEPTPTPKPKTKR